MTTPDDVYILGLDPSTDITGAALIKVSATGEVEVLTIRKLNATAILGTRSTLTARIQRIRWTRTMLSAWLNSFEYGIDEVAYEMDTQRGFASSEALKMATGAYLSLSTLDSVPVAGITRLAACGVAGCTKLYFEPVKGKSTAEIADKKARLKAAVIAWANARFPELDLQADDDAIADALAIAVKAGETWYRSSCVRRIALEELAKAKAARQEAAKAARRKTPKEKVTA